MQSIDGGYFCGECEKKVYDVSDYTESEFEKLRKKNEKVCVSFKKVITLSLVLSLSACTSTKTTEIHEKTKESCTSSHKKTAGTKNPLAPFKIIDKNQTVQLDEVQYEVGGDINPVTVFEQEPFEEEKKKD